MPAYEDALNGAAAERTLVMARFVQ